jgi:hypothetical protein
MIGQRGECRRFLPTVKLTSVGTTGPYSVRANKESECNHRSVEKLLINRRCGNRKKNVIHHITLAL